MTDTITHEITTAKATSPRSRVRASWLLLAGAMFLLTAIVVWWGISNASDRTQALVVTRPVAAGEVITADSLGTTPVSIDGGAGQVFLAEQRNDIIDTIALVDLATGDLLQRSMIAATQEVRPGEQLVGAVIRAGRYPSEIQQGDVGLAVQSETQQGADAPSSAPIRIVSVSISETSEAAVTLAVQADRSAQVGVWAGEGQMVLVLEPIGAEE